MDKTVECTFVPLLMLENLKWESVIIKLIYHGQLLLTCHLNLQNNSSLNIIVMYILVGEKIMGTRNDQKSRNAVQSASLLASLKCTMHSNSDTSNAISS